MLASIAVCFLSVSWSRWLCWYNEPVTFMNLRAKTSRWWASWPSLRLACLPLAMRWCRMYKAICEMTGINILSLAQVPGNGCPGRRQALPANTQVDTSRTITVEFDANARGPWEFKPAQRSVQVHPGELTTVMYEFQKRAKPAHGGAGHSQLCAQAGCGAFQQAGMLLLQPVHAGARREKSVAGGLCD
jgi:cytochrome c oxidase assembly protein Cox11